MLEISTYPHSSAQLSLVHGRDSFLLFLFFFEGKRDLLATDLWISRLNAIGWKCEGVTAMASL